MISIHNIKRMGKKISSLEKQYDRLIAKHPRAVLALHRIEELATRFDNRIQAELKRKI